MVGILIVSHNSEDVIGRCLEACNGKAHRVLVIDNASTDGTVAEVRRYPDVVLTANRENRGFAAAVNQGVALLDTPFVLILNPDTVLTTSVEAMWRCFDDPSVGAATGQLLGNCGTDQSIFHLRRLPGPWVLATEALGINRLWPSSPWNRHYRCGAAGAADVEQPAGAYLMVRRSAFEQLGGFDESFHPIWFEDVDFCKRLRDNAWKIRYTDGSRAEHLGGHSANQISWGARQLFWYVSLLRYASKHFSAASRLTVCLAVMFACVPRMVAGVLLSQSAEPMRVFSKIWWSAGMCLLSGRVKGHGSGRSQTEQVTQPNAAGSATV
jgi:GT2 family glycosyltransferase